MGILTKKENLNMAISMKPQQPENSTPVADGAWDEWNEYFYSLLDSKEQPFKNKEGVVVEGKFFKKKKAVGVLKMIADVGFQPQIDADYDWKGVAGTDEEYSDEEKAHCAKFTDNYFRTVDGKRKQFKPVRPTQEYALYYDFPKVMVDWTKHPVEELHKLGNKPLRVCYNGYIKIPSKGVDGFARNLRFAPNWKTNKLSPNNPLCKIASAMGLGEQYDKEYDLGVLIDGACFFDLFLNKNVKDGRTFYQEDIKNYSEITEMELPNGDIFTVEQQIPECPSEAVGVLLNGGDYSEDVLNIVRHRKELMAVLPKATNFQPNAVKAPDFYLGANWEDSDLCKALGMSVAPANSVDTSKPSDSVPVKQTPVTEPVAKPEPTPVNAPSDMTWDDTIPF